MSEERKTWTATPDTRDANKGALLFGDSVALEIAKTTSNMRKAARLASLLNEHGVVLDGAR